MSYLQKGFVENVRGYVHVPTVIRDISALHLLTRK